MLETEVVIVGAGVAGLAMALELRSRKIDFVLLDQGDERGAPDPGVVGPRAMELLRRWGVAGAIRGAGWPGDHPLDCAWVTRVGGHELYRLTRYTMDTRPPFRHTPEPPAICPRHWLEPLLRDELGSHPDGPVRPRSRLEGFEPDGDGVTVTVSDAAAGPGLRVRARYLVDCDGTDARVRENCGIAAPTRYKAQRFRDILFRAPRLRERLGERHAALFYLMASPAARYPLVAVDGAGLYRLSIHAAERVARQTDAATVIGELLAEPTPVRIVADSEWWLAPRVAERFGHERVFLVGDAAHALAPAGGFGQDLGICDAANLGWKLAAALHGWAGPGLLASYTAERRPTALVALTEAQRNLHRAQARTIPEELNDDTPDGERARRAMRAGLVVDGAAHEFDAPRIHLGFRYPDSPVVVADPSAPPDGAPRPNSRPGSRAPHAWVRPGMSTLDLFGDSFVLLRTTSTHAATDPEPWTRAFTARRVPLRVLDHTEPEVAAAYERPLVLVRPDGHVAWRGNRPAEDLGRLADTVRGGRAQ
ncbi:FAD-dependent oxidoreductase [Pseudonocardia eucalypti]|uniref:FAD-dependent oxidoreductase n=1 Tax=Pseudonocardia eucalypti TaxID=648755 RepID=A0ABP9QFX1_9PSEU|nr:2-polyprenyl-6-methoxyphenol hydroxylase-like FAD-dependent oxidoreductase [Pseudonocardia eucalypti]